jgi:AcrR family transcriptional regulator
MALAAAPVAVALIGAGLALVLGFLLWERRAPEPLVDLALLRSRTFTGGAALATVEQIADAVEVSPSTFFRYFPTKDALVLTDDYDPVMVERFRAQPSDLGVVAAFRSALRETFADLPRTSRRRPRSATPSSCPCRAAGGDRHTAGAPGDRLRALRGPAPG